MLGSFGEKGLLENLEFVGLIKINKINRKILLDISLKKCYNNNIEKE